MTKHIVERSTIGIGKLFLSALLVLAMIAAITISGTVWWGIQDIEQFKQLGPWGDFFGGFLNPILTFLTFLGVLFTIGLQKIELNLTRQEMARSADALENQLKALEKQLKAAEDQSFENTFFRLLELHNTIVDSIDLRRDGHEISHGRDCFNAFYARLKTVYTSRKKNSPNETDDVTLEIAYQEFWSRYQSDLGHYFRFLFNVIRFIQKDSLGDDFYIKLLRSQLSDQELLLLFYNCLSTQGRKFKTFAEEFALFDNMPIGLLLNPDHANRFDNRAYGNNPQAPQIT